MLELFSRKFTLSPVVWERLWWLLVVEKSNDSWSFLRWHQRGFGLPVDPHEKGACVQPSTTHLALFSDILQMVFSKYFHTSEALRLDSIGVALVWEVLSWKSIVQMIQCKSDISYWVRELLNEIELNPNRTLSQRTFFELLVRVRFGSIFRNTTEVIFYILTD